MARRVLRVEAGLDKSLMHHFVEEHAAVGDEIVAATRIGELQEMAAADLAVSGPHAAGQAHTSGRAAMC